MRTITGLQPSGQLHIGNYFGAIKPAVELQQQGDVYCFVANYHAMTTCSDAALLQQNTLDATKDLIAAGFNSEKSVLFWQSAVPEVHELAWILSTVCPMGLLERATSYKDKLAKGIKANHGLFAYPLLMAADILLYDAQYVPVGKDQKQHVEITRDIADKINDIFQADTLVLPEAIIREDVALIQGIDGGKMSKSYHNTIPLYGNEKKIKKIFMKIVTDSADVESPKTTDNSVILNLYQLVATASDYQNMYDAFLQGGQGYGHFKTQLFEAYWEYFRSFRTRREELDQHPELWQAVLAAGAEQARTIADKTLQRVKKNVGLTS